MHLLSEPRASAESIPQTSKVVTVLTAAALLYTRSAGVAFFVTGALLCSKLAKVIKKAIRQERPSQLSGRKVSYGCGNSIHFQISDYIVNTGCLARMHPRAHSSLYILPLRALSYLSTLPSLILLCLLQWLSYHGHA
jgi:dolichyldiphosphatase